MFTSIARIKLTILQDKNWYLYSTDKFFLREIKELSWDHADGKG